MVLIDAAAARAEWIVTRSSPRHGTEPALTDAFGRAVRYLRLSVTDRCDFRCTYCMAKHMQFLPRHDILSHEESLLIASAFVAMGVTKIRVTGGEPLVRRDILWLLERLKQLPGLDELVLTTNGSQLERYAKGLKAAGVSRINISLDTLNPARFQSLTRTGALEDVLRGIQAAKEAQFDRIKLNTVLLRGINDGELTDLVRFALGQELDLTFIEEMPLGDIGRARNTTFFTADEAKRRLAPFATLIPTTESTGGPARYFRVGGSTSRIGFITPHSEHFCDTCNRVRITARGELFPCLGHESATPLLPLLRSSEQSPAQRTAALCESIRQALLHKPQGHDFARQIGTPKVMRHMSTTGG